VDVDEAGRDDPAGGVDGRGPLADLPHGRDAPTVDGDVGDHGRGAGPVDDGPAL
jgi:hypothetical protein